MLFFTAPAAAQQYNYNYDSLKRIITLHPDDTGSIKAYIDYASKFFYTKSDLSILYLDKATGLARKKADNYLYLYALKNKGDYYVLSGNYEAASKIYKQAISLPSPPKYWLLKVKLKSNLATAYKNMGLLDAAQGLFENAMKDFDAHNKNHQDSIAWAFSFFQLFDVYKAQGLMEEAFYYGEMGNGLALRLNFARGIGYGLYVKALKYQNSSQQLALRFCDSALIIAVEKKIPDLEQFASALKAKIFIRQKRYREAESVILKINRFTSAAAQLVTDAKLADIYYYLGNLPRAQMFFKRSYQLAKTAGNQAEISEILLTGVAIYERLKDYKTALKLQKEYQQVAAEITSDKLKVNFQQSALKFKNAEKDKQLVQKQLQLAQKDNQIARQSFFTFIAVFATALITVLWALHNRHQKKLQQQQALTAEAAKEFQALEAMMKGEELERQRLAKDLHDGIGGILSAIKMTASTLMSQHEELKRSDTFKSVITMLDNASADVRKTAHNLMPDMLARFGLYEAIRLFCEHINQRNNLAVHYQTIGGIARYEDSFELVVYRIVMELLNNIIKHANAKQVLVQFARNDNMLCISVEDDGIGFDPALNKTDGLGLSSLKERVMYLKGTLDLDSGLGQGTAVNIEFDVSGIIKYTEAV